MGALVLLEELTEVAGGRRCHALKHAVASAKMSSNNIRNCKVSPYTISVIRHSRMGAQATGEVHRSHGGHYDVYQGGESFDDVIQVELEFLHRHAKKAD